MGKSDSKPSLGQRLKTRFHWILGLVALLWALEIVNSVSGGSLRTLGIRPRSLEGLWGIALAPFIHANVPHLISNTIPLLVLGALVAARGVRSFLAASLAIILLGGAGVWIAGTPGTVHVGASGLILGYFGCILARAWYERSVGSILLAVVAVALYGGLIFGVFPSRALISWESHLFGLIAGFLVGRFQAGANKNRRRPPA